MTQQTASVSLGFSVAAGTTTTTPAPTGNQYYVATTGNDNNAGTSVSPFLTLQKGVSVLQPGDTLTVRSGSYSQGIVIGWDPNGLYGAISGTSGAPITIQADPATPGTVIITGRSNKVDSGIDIEPANGQCSYLIFKGFIIDGTNSSMASYGIKNTCNNNQFINNTIRNMATSCISGLFTNGTSNILFQGNTVSGVKGAGDDRKGHGIYVANSSNVTVTGNTFFNNDYIGIHINGDPNQVTNSVFEKNVIFNNGSNAINADGLQTSVIQNNLIYAYAGFGIVLYFSDSAAASKNNLIINNTIVSTVGGAGAAVRMNDGSQPNTIYNNILLGGSNVVGRIASDTMTQTFGWNILPVSPQLVEDIGGGISNWPAGFSANSVSATPAQLFVNPATPDYHEVTGSPSIDAGTSTTAPSTDIDGNARPLGGGYDIGCYER